MITLEQFWRIEAAVRDAGHADAIAWSESIAPPTTADAFAEHAIYVICNSGMRNRIALVIYRTATVDTILWRAHAKAGSSAPHPKKG